MMRNKSKRTVLLLAVTSVCTLPTLEQFSARATEKISRVSHLYEESNKTDRQALTEEEITTGNIVVTTQHDTDAVINISTDGSEYFSRKNDPSSQHFTTKTSSLLKQGCKGNGLCDAHVTDENTESTFSPNDIQNSTEIQLLSTTPECKFAKLDCALLLHVINNAKPKTTTPSVLSSTDTQHVAVTIMTTPNFIQSRAIPTDGVPSSVVRTTTHSLPVVTSLQSQSSSVKRTTLPVTRTTLDFEQFLVDVIKKSNVSVPPSTFSEFELKKLVTEVNGVNSATVNITTVNSILSRLDRIVNGSEEFTSANVSHLLLNISKWETADHSTIKECSSIISKIVENTKVNASYKNRNERMIIMQNTLLTMDNILTSSVTTELTMSSSSIDILTKTVRNGTTDIQVENGAEIIIISQQLFINRIVRISTVVFTEDVGRNLDNHGSMPGAQISSKVVGVSLQDMNYTKPQSIPVTQKGAIIITLPTEIKRKEKTRMCCYWNFKVQSWASDGGVVLEKNDTHTTCVFDHLTNFAVLVLYYDDIEDKLTVSQENVLMIMTTVGCSISITCLGMTIFAFFYLKLMWKETILVHGNLSVALLLGQLVLVASDEALKDRVACKAVAMVMHYFFLASFTWMLMEGIALYMSCTRGLHYHGNMKWKYILIGWGVPLVIVVISIGAEFQNYGTEDNNICWLSTNDGLIWAFMGPMLVIIMFNIFVLAMVVRVFLTLEANARQSDAAKLRCSVRAIIFLLPLLGTTWLLSILVPLHVTFHYLFVLGNSLQGMLIFFLHCICNKEIRKRIKERKKQLGISQKTYGESNSARPRQKTVDAFCDVQVEMPSTDRKYAWVS